LARDVDVFCRAQYPRLVGMLGLYCGDGDLAEDLVQEALVRLVRAWDQLPTDEDAERWLTRVAFNLAKSNFRARATRRRVLATFGHTLVDSANADDHASVFAVRAAVASLPERERRVVILRFFADLSVAEVAAIIGRPEGTVKSLTHAALERLRRAGLEVADD
jgi:RNA polymerase sigma-70 factor (ECF subfamily)